MKVLVYSIHNFDKPYLEKASRGKHEFVYTELPLNEQTAGMATGFNAVALLSSDSANASVLQKLNKCGIRFIALRSVGHDHVDLHVASELNIKVANVPGYSPYSVAEHGVALLMALNRKLIEANRLFQKNDFRLDTLVGFDLHGKTVGIVGTGKIGSVFARIMYGFGCQILGYDILENEALKKEIKIQYVKLNELCNRADVICIACPLNENTRHLFNKKLFGEMKKGAYLINIGRGGIVNTVDLIEALENGIVGAAGLDVYENEKPLYFYDRRNMEIKDEIFLKLRSMPNVLMTAHQAFLTREALQGIASVTVQNLDEWQSTGFSRNDLN